MEKTIANVGIKVSVSLEDEFLKYEPRTERERLFKQILINAINAQPVDDDIDNMWRKQQAMQLGALIKGLVEEGFSIEKAWDAVCNDSKELEFRRIPENSKLDFEATGSIGAYGLADTQKFLSDDAKNGVGWLILSE